MVFLQVDSTLVLCLLFVVSSFFVVITSFWSGRKDGVLNLLPSPPALPIIGNLHQLGQGYHHRKLQAMARRHGPLFLLRLGSLRAIVVSSASMAEAVLKTQDHIFCSRPQMYTARGIFYASRDVAFSPYGERWRHIRRIAVANVLSVKRVDSFCALREEALTSFVERIRDQGGREAGFDVSELFISLTNTVISREAFANKLGGVEISNIRDMMEEISDLLGTISVSDVFPRLGWVDWAMGLDARVNRTAAKLDVILERALGEHERTRRNEDEARDLLDDLLLIVRDGDQGFKLDRTDVKALISDIFIAGTDTTSKAIQWTMAELVKNPGEMEKVQAEVRQVAGARGGVVEEDLEKMTLLKAAMKEALRLHPPAPLLVPHESMQDTQRHGYHIPARTRVMINAWAIGRDDELWENAEEFRPDRFVHKTVDYNGQDLRFIPFGAGRRGCPGIASGTRLGEFTLANMMYHFDWKLADGQDPESFDLTESSGLVPGLKSPLILAVTPMYA